MQENNVKIALLLHHCKCNKTFSTRWHWECNVFVQRWTDPASTPNDRSVMSLWGQAHMGTTATLTHRNSNSRSPARILSCLWNLHTPAWKSQLPQHCVLFCWLVIGSTHTDRYTNICKSGRLLTNKAQDSYPILSSTLFLVFYLRSFNVSVFVLFRFHGPTVFYIWCLPGFLLCFSLWLACWKKIKSSWIASNLGILFQKLAFLWAQVPLSVLHCDIQSLISM